MKKKFISICITLFIFIGSVVPVFALETVADVNVPYWLLDIRHQCFLAHNVADVKFGLAIYGNEIAHYLVEIVGGGDLYLTYEVPAGETVYFRWAIARNNMGNHGFNTHVRRSINGTPGYEKIYDYNNLGDYGTYGSIVIVEDYTNTSNSTQMVTYVLGNNHTTATTTTYEYVPILVGTDVIINQGTTTDFGEFDYTVDLTNVEDKLDDIIELLSSRPNDINFEVPFDLWQVYNFFINSYNYSYSTSPDRIPWLVRNQVFDKVYNDSQGFRTFESDYVYFTFMAPFKDSAKPSLLGRDGTVINAYTLKTSPRANGFGLLYTYGFNVARNTYYSLYLPDVELFSKFIPIYLGNGTDIPDSLAHYIGLQSTTQSLINVISSKLTLLTEVFTNTQTTITDKANTANNNLSNSITEFDNIEKEQVNNFTQNIANLPSFDFGSISDFSTTANFVSTQMQNIYNSSDYIRFIYTAVLTFGIALVLIGRGLRR